MCVLAVAVSLSTACSDDDAEASDLEDLEEATGEDIAIQIERCGEEDAATVESAMGVEVVDRSTSTGGFVREDVVFGRDICAFTTADGEIFAVGLAHEADDPRAAWETMRGIEDEPEPDEPAAWAADSGLADRVDELITRDGDGLVARIGENGYLFKVVPHFTADEEVTTEQLQDLSAVAAEVLADAPTDPHAFCNLVDEVASERYGFDGRRTQGPSLGGDGGGRYEYRGCRTSLDDDVRIDSQIGGLDFFNARGGGGEDHGIPAPAEGIGVRALSWGDEVFVPVGDDLLLFRGERNGETMGTDELAVFVDAVLAR